MRVTRIAARCLIAGAVSVVAVHAADAQTPEEFYKGKVLNLIIPNAPGGSFDLYARLAANHLRRFIPGNPSIVAQNMPGAAGMQAANYLTSIAPKDGTVLSVLVPNITLAQILGVQSIAYDTRKFNWIGRIIAHHCHAIHLAHVGYQDSRRPQNPRNAGCGHRAAQPGGDQFDHAQWRGRHQVQADPRL